ncbi:Alpha-N-acetylgalactosamine-specific lectin [Amphibalanus amphitrite]|uniref:Alpha-N-acetylgalactosamine-specific lectin n=1 Tax=Amphibalanus amphitrite TaxID=1232801 RepID=A0A6A4XFZ0_AMPAM|nr:Alpha-N-acetylgalactosamine-specific lectin [Amphibalanus amphitrite]
MLFSILLAVFVSGTFSQSTCPSGWTLFQSNCYRLFNQKVYFYDAMVGCANSVTAHPNLASIHSAEENTFLQTFVSAYDYVWIGLHDMTTEGTFQWTDASPVNFTNWAGGQPDNLNDSDCVLMLRDGTWDDGECERKFGHTTPAKAYVCKTRAV